MTIMLEGLALALALACAALMGLAIQRGATCTVAAVEELMDRRRPVRLLAMAEASLWVGGSLLALHELGRLMHLPAGYALTRWTLAGAAVLGLGAWLNRACVFGAIARLGSGEWAYVATPLGFYVGCLSVGSVFAPPVPQALAEAPAVLGWPPALAWLAAALVAARMLMVLRWRRGVPWSAHAATAVIGLSFLALLMLAGAWTYTDVLADLAHGMWQSVAVRVLLAAALLLGSLAGGMAAGKWQATLPSLTSVLRCFAGGLLMGWGSLLIPGGNDGLVLLGMPLFWPYAWVSVATMCAAIAAAMWVQQRVASSAGISRRSRKTDKA
jgi:uncharacterized membrane protein YedE/YeeE